jgi:SMC interacting uncharacterized protein involved in chromosome segregation
VPPAEIQGTFREDSRNIRAGFEEHSESFYYDLQALVAKVRQLEHELEAVEISKAKMKAMEREVAAEMAALEQDRVSLQSSVEGLQRRLHHQVGSGHSFIMFSMNSLNHFFF